MREERDARRSLRAGIIGAGLMGRWHAHAATAAGARVAVIVDSDVNAARALAARHPHAAVLSNYAEAVSQRSVDVLHVCTPPATHVAIAEAAVHAGIPALIEKPMTPRAPESERLLALAHERGIPLCPAHQFLFQDGVRAALAHLPRIGKIIHLELTVCSTGGGSADGAHADDIVADILPHPFSLMHRFLGGLPTQGWVTAHPGPGELRATAQASGATLAIFISMNARPTVCAFDVVGTAGTMHMDLYHGYAVIEPGGAGRARKIFHPFDRALRTLGAATANLARRTRRWEPAYPGLRNLIAAFYAAVRQGGACPIAPDDTIAVARLRDLIVAQAGLGTAPLGQ